MSQTNYSNLKWSSLMDRLKIERSIIVPVTLVCEGALLLVASCWCLHTGVSLRDKLQLDLMSISTGVGAGVLTACSCFLLLFIANKFKSLTWLAAMRAMVYDEVWPIFSQLNLIDIFLLAAASGLCEEVFFRGVLQPATGILQASVIFGLVHCPSFTMLPYAFWTFLAGLFLGWLYLLTNNLWTPILAHAVSNFIMLVYFKYKK
jgi:uncharacterized protein